MEKQKGLTCNIYRCDRDGIDTTNGGQSAKVERVILVPPEGEEFNDCRVFEADEKTPAFKVVKRIIRSSVGDEYLYVHAEPLNPVKSGNDGYMAGGNILYSCDSRWKRITGVSYPIQIHDRQE